MKHRGFTLIETVVYVGLFGVLMTGGVVTLYALMTSIADNRTVLATYTEMQFVHQKVAWSLMGATAVTAISSSSLEINRPDLGFDSPLVISVTDEQFYLTRGDGPELLLSSVDVPITDAVFIVEVNPLTLHTEVTLQYFARGIPFSYRTVIY
jgi:hypothetical protein